MMRNCPNELTYCQFLSRPPQVGVNALSVENISRVKASLSLTETEHSLFALSLTYPMLLHFEDINESLSLMLGPRILTLEDSLRFSNEFDRLPIHLDRVAASDSIYGSLIASGLHTLALTASIVVDEFLAKTTMTGASGMTDVRWYAPVRPPEKISVRISAREKTPPQPGRSFGTVKMLLETFNAEKEMVMSATVSYLFRCHSPQTKLTVA